MSRVNLVWEGPFFDFEQDVLDTSKGIYMFVENDLDSEGNLMPKGVLYVGMTYEQSFRDEIMAKFSGEVGDWLSRYNYTLGENLTVKIAHVQLLTQDRISEELVRDVENLLIFLLQPLGNIQGKESYRGRIPLFILNEGRSRPLPEKLSTNGFTRAGITD